MGLTSSTSANLSDLSLNPGEHEVSLPASSQDNYKARELLLGSPADKTTVTEAQRYWFERQPSFIDCCTHAGQRSIFFVSSLPLGWHVAIGCGSDRFRCL